MYEGPAPLPDGISLSIITNTSGEGPTHLKVTVKGQNMAYWDTHMKIYAIIGKTTYLSNLKGLNGQKHHFTYHFLYKVNMYLQALIYIYIYL